MIVFLMFVALAIAQVGWSPFLGGLIVRQSTSPSPWGNESTPGALGCVTVSVLFFSIQKGSSMHRHTYGVECSPFP